MSNRNNINKVTRQAGLGTLTSASSNIQRGFNHLNVGSPAPQNTDNHGLTFFTRPRLNLSYDNVGSSRILAPLLGENVYSLPRVIRVLLDHVGAVERNVTTPLVDDRMAFIPMLTNNLLSISGWPDPDMDTYTSQEGIAKESWSMIEDIPRYYGTYDLNATFRNVEGDPITALFQAWTHYAAAVSQGELVPYPEMIVENEIDYMTRIYRIVLDPKREIVQKIAACGACFPTSVPLGAAFNYNSDSPLNQENEQISIPFKAMGAEYNDTITILEFNTTVAIFNPGMQDRNRAQLFTKLTFEDKLLFNYEGYPWISEDYELEWWVPNDRYRLLKAQQTAF